MESLHVHWHMDVAVTSVPSFYFYVLHGQYVYQLRMMRLVAAPSTSGFSFPPPSLEHLKVVTTNIFHFSNSRGWPWSV